MVLHQRWSPLPEQKFEILPYILHLTQQLSLHKQLAGPCCVGEHQQSHQAQQVRPLLLLECLM